MEQEVVAQRILKELLDLNVVNEEDEDVVWAYLLMAYSAGWDESQSSRSKKQPVMQLDRNDKVLKIHQSIKAAAIDMDCNVATIGKALRGKVQTVHGYKWKYVNEKEPNSSEGPGTVGGRSGKLNR